jgi:hypothetical protein
MLARATVLYQDNAKHLTGCAPFGIALRDVERIRE